MRDQSMPRYRAMTPLERDLLLFQDCFNRNGQPRTLERLRWQYVDTPGGRPFVDFAEDPAAPESLAAIYALVPMWMKIGAQRRLGVQSLDTLTDIKFRGRGIFTKMAATIFARCTSEGVAMVFGFPNGNSAPGFFTKLGWPCLDPLPVVFKPLRLKYLAQKLRLPFQLPEIADIPMTRARKPTLRAGEELRAVTRFDAEFDLLWASFSQTIDVAVERDSQYLNWRIQRPTEEYTAVALYDNSQLRGFFITSKRESHGLVIGTVMELMYVPTDSRAGDILMRAAVHDLFQSGASAIWAWNFGHSPNHPSFRRAGFVSPPRRLLPELHFGALGLQPGLDEILLHPKNWYLSMLDCDTA